MGGRPAAGEEHQRLFIAVPVAEAVRERIAEAVSAAREAEPAGQADHGRVRWVSTAGLHLTLKFLGSTDPGRLAAVREVVAATAVEARPAELGLRGVGAFPSAGRPRVLWMGLVHGREELAGIAAGLDARLAPLGWPPETRPFRAHLTLARCDEPAAARAALEALERAAGSLDLAWTADRLVLFRSHLGHGPARYEPLLEAPLGG